MHQKKKEATTTQTNESSITPNPSCPFPFKVPNRPATAEFPLVSGGATLLVLVTVASKLGELDVLEGGTVSVEEVKSLAVDIDVSVLRVEFAVADPDVPGLRVLVITDVAGGMENVVVNVVTGGLVDAEEVSVAPKLVSVVVIVTVLVGLVSVPDVVDVGKVTEADENTIHSARTIPLPVS